MCWLGLLIQMLVDWAGGRTYNRRLSHARWQRIAMYQRMQHRTQLHEAFWEARLNRMSHAVEKILITHNAPLIGQQAGYVYIEVPPLLKWLVKGNHGVEELLGVAIRNMAEVQLREALAL